MSIENHLSDRVADAAGAASVLVPVGITIADVNQYLQAGAFVVSMIAGLCAAVYYIKKSRDK